MRRAGLPGPTHRLVGMKVATFSASNDAMSGNQIGPGPPRSPDALARLTASVKAMMAPLVENSDQVGFGTPSPRWCSRSHSLAHVLQRRRVHQK